MPLLDLVPGWELVQLASMAKKGSVFGRVRANKILSFLQLGGYPVPIKFRIIRMGPASKDVDARAAAASEQGLLTVREEPTRFGFEPRVDYMVTARGREYVADVLMPALHAHPNGELYIDVLSDTADARLYGSSEQLVQDVHRLLHLDDKDELIAAYVDTRATLEEKGDDFARRSIRDRVDLAAAGAVDFALLALEAAQPLLNDPEYTEAGAFHVLANAESLAGMLDPLQTMHVDHRRDKAVARRYDRLLNALEWNAALYGIAEVPTDEQIDRMFQEEGPYDPDLGML